MPHVIAVGTRSQSSWVVRLFEPIAARWGWITGRVPVGVTPTLPTSRWWH